MATGHKITRPMICMKDIFKINDVQMILCPRDMFLGVVGYHIKNQRLLKQTLSVLSPRVWGQDIYPCVKVVDFWYIVHYQDIIIERWARHSFQVKLTAYLPGEKKSLKSDTYKCYGCGVLIPVNRHIDYWMVWYCCLIRLDVCVDCLSFRDRIPSDTCVYLYIWSGTVIA